MSGSPQQPEQTSPRCYRHGERETWISCQRCGRPICPDCMRPASVGFHCPQCVSAAESGQRTARKVAGGRVPAAPGRATLALIGANLAVFVLVLGTGGSASEVYQQSFMLTDSRPLFGLTGVDDGAWWRLLTSAFLHLQVLHIAFNMFALYVLGPPLERLVGQLRMVGIYLTTGLAGSVAVLWLGDPRIPTVGASGAVFGIFGAAIVLMRSRGYDISSLAMVLGINLVITFAVPNISWQAHLGGLLVGMALGAVLAYTPRPRRRVAHPVAFVGLWTGLVLAVAAHVLL
ncbi:rhomboid family intramembrane serine protease [soil metagenome]